MEAEEENEDVKYKCENCYEHFFNLISLQLHLEEKHSSIQVMYKNIFHEEEQSEKLSEYEDDEITDTNDSLAYQDNADDEDYEVENDEDDEEDDDIEDEDEEDIEDVDQNSVVYTDCRTRSSKGTNVEKPSFETEKNEEHQCDVCHESFSSFVSLHCHQAVHSIGKVPVKEEDSDIDADDQSPNQVSNISYISNLNYSEEKLWETEELPYKCDVCYESFSSSILLTGHKVVHSVYRNPPKKNTEEKRFKCEVCQKKFRRGGDLEGHMRTHTGERPFVCEFCDRAFKLKGDLKKHTYRHTGERPFPCDVCGKNFSRSYSLKLHQKTHIDSRNDKKALLKKSQDTNKPIHNTVVIVDSDEPVSDEDLSQVYQSSAILNSKNTKYPGMGNFEEEEEGNIDQSNEYETNFSHVASEQSRLFRFECEICDEWYTEENFLADHMKKHSDEKPFQCGICQTAFSRVNDLTDHMLGHAGDSLPRYQDPLEMPPEDFTVEVKEDSEEEKLSADEEIKTFKCEFCDKAFITKISIFQAHRDSHTSDTPYECGLCEKSYRTRGTMLNHKKMHSNIRPVIECDICHHRFTKKHSLENHKRIHTGEKPFKCKFCNHEFRKRSALNVHLRLHMNDKKYKCGICGRAFVEQHILKGHMRVHTGEKPYFCQVCNKSFRIAAGLRIHSRIHTGEKPYSCDICEKSFVQMGSLMYHKQTHRDEKSFQCDDCEKYFSTKCYLQQHKKKYCSVRKLCANQAE